MAFFPLAVRPFKINCLFCISARIAFAMIKTKTQTVNSTHFPENRTFFRIENPPTRSWANDILNFLAFTHGGKTKNHFDTRFLCVMHKLPPVVTQHPLIRGIMSVLFFMCVFCFSPSRIQIWKYFDAKQTIYFKQPYSIFEKCAGPADRKVWFRISSKNYMIHPKAYKALKFGEL